VNDLEHSFDIWIAEASGKGSVDVVSALRSLHVTCRQLCGGLQTAISVLHSNVNTDLNETAEKLERCNDLLQAATVLRSRISEIVADSDGYPREVEALVQESMHLLETLRVSTVDWTEDETALERHAQSRNLHKSIATVISNLMKNGTHAASL
jgi:hypothetical protein